MNLSPPDLDCEESKKAILPIKRLKIEENIEKDEKSNPSPDFHH